MSERGQSIVERNVVYSRTEMQDVSVQKAQLAELELDLYSPVAAEESVGRPAVVIVAGYPDAGFHRLLGCRFKDMVSTSDWARLIAASGMVAITYTNVDPDRDLRRLLEHLRGHAGELHINANAIALWASSGNVPLALSALMTVDQPFRCAALLYGYMLDLQGSTDVADASAKFGFANPTSKASLDDLPRETPLFVVRAGADQMPGLNGSIDRFAIEALRRNHALTLVNHATGPHAFDLFDLTEASRAVIRQTLDFLRLHCLTNVR